MRIGILNAEGPRKGSGASGRRKTQRAPERVLGPAAGNGEVTRYGHRIRGTTEALEI
jgi:hypothetical protein